jgi:hypothetical protein
MKRNLRVVSGATFAKDLSLRSLRNRRGRLIAATLARPWVCAKGDSQPGLPFFSALRSLQPTANKMAAMSA